MIRYSRSGAVLKEDNHISVQRSIDPKAETIAFPLASGFCAVHTINGDTDIFLGSAAGPGESVVSHASVKQRTVPDLPLKEQPCSELFKFVLK